MEQNSDNYTFINIYNCNESFKNLKAKYINRGINMIEAKEKMLAIWRLPDDTENKAYLFDQEIDKVYDCEKLFYEDGFMPFVRIIRWFRRHYPYNDLLEGYRTDDFYHDYCWSSPMEETHYWRPRPYEEVEETDALADGYTLTTVGVYAYPG